MQLLPKVSKRARCGECDTCLNPQKKKACLSVRRQQMDDLESEGNLPLSLLPEANKQPSTGQPSPQKPASKRAPSDPPGPKRAKPTHPTGPPSSPKAKATPLEIRGAPRPPALQPRGLTLGQAMAAPAQGPPGLAAGDARFHEQLGALMREDGVILEGMVGKMAALMQQILAGENVTHRQHVLLAMLEIITPSVAAVLVHTPAMGALQAWLQEAARDFSARGNQKLAVRVLKVAGPAACAASMVLIMMPARASASGISCLHKLHACLHQSPLQGPGRDGCEVISGDLLLCLSVLLDCLHHAAGTCTKILECALLR